MCIWIEKIVGHCFVCLIVDARKKTLRYCHSILEVYLIYEWYLNLLISCFSLVNVWKYAVVFFLCELFSFLTIKMCCCCYIKSGKANILTIMGPFYLKHD